MTNEEQINVDTNAQLIEEASRKMEQKIEESEFSKLKSGMLEIEARLFNRKMRRAYKFHRAEPWNI